MRYQYRGVTKDRQGRVIQSGTVSVFLAGTSTPANIYTTWDGTTAVNSVNSDANGVFTFFVDAFDYGSSQTFKFVISKTAFSTYTQDNVKVEDVVLGTYTISANKTVSYDLDVPKGVVFNINNGVTLNLNGPFSAGLYQVFAGTGSVIFSRIKAFYPQWWGGNPDGSTDNSAAIQAAIDSAKNTLLGKGGKVVLTTGQWSIGTTTITLYEGIRLLGEGRGEYVSSAPAGGTWIFYTGTGNAITIDGEWTGFDSRREIEVGNLSIKLTDSNSAIYADFMTQFNIHDVNIKGTGTYGIYSVNSYNGSYTRVKVDGPTNGYYLTIKASPNDVFSGQTIFEGCDFWNGTAGKGVHITASVNVLAQMVFSKCHFKNNAYGVYVSGGNAHKINFLGCHFEANLTNDLYVHSDVTRGPVVKGCHFNNANAVYKIDVYGNTATIEDNEFTGSTTGKGIKINGSDNYVARNYFYDNLNSQTILIDASATRNTIGKNIFSNTTGRVVDNSTAKTTIYEGETIVDSGAFTLSSAASTETKFMAVHEYWIESVKIIYPVATSADAGVALQFGYSTSLSAFVNHTSDASQAAYSVVSPTLSSTYIAKDRIVTFRCAGGKVGAGTAKFSVRLVPFMIS